MEYCGTGTLRDFLNKKQQQKKIIPWEMKLQFARDIALRLNYLHSNKIIHSRSRE